ncbi:ABC transporter permease [bacterium]|nr:MAG: ABC transporter permease [bacterium]
MRTLFSGLRREALSFQNAGVYYALLLIVAIFTVLTSAKGGLNYISGVNAANILDQMAIVGLLAVVTTIVLISGNFDLSVGSVAALSGAVGLALLDRYGVYIALAAALTVGLLVGLLNGVLVQVVRVNAFIVTLGTLTAVRGLLLLLTNARTVSANSLALTNVENVYQRTPNLLPLIGIVLLGIGLVTVFRNRSELRPAALRASVWLLIGAALVVYGIFNPYTLVLDREVYFMFAVTIAAWLVLRFTIVGRRLYAVGGNSEAARLSGIRVNLYRIGALVLSGVAAAFAGTMYAARIGAVTPDAMTGMELTVLAAAILGGTSLFGGFGSVIKSIVGTAILFTLANGFNVMNLGSNYQGLIQGAVIITAATIYTASGRAASHVRRGTARPTSVAASPSSGLEAPPSSNQGVQQARRA